MFLKIHLLIKFILICGKWKREKNNNFKNLVKCFTKCTTCLNTNSHKIHFPSKKPNAYAVHG